jgi:hypothetical protein
MPGYIQELRQMTVEQRENALSEKIEATYRDLTHTDRMGSVIAETNALGWGVEDFNILDKIEDIDVSGDEVRVNISFSGSGDQEEDHGFLGDSLAGNAVAVINDDGDVEYHEISAEIDEGPEDDDEPDIYVEGQTE